MLKARIHAFSSLTRSAALSSTSALTVAQGLVLCSSLLVNIMSARVLGPSGRGELALHLQVSYLLGSAIVLGRDQALLVHGPFVSIKSAHNTLRRLALVPAALCVGLAILLASYFATNGSEFLGYLAAYAAMLSGSLCFRLGRAVAIATARPWHFSVATGVGQILLVSAAIVLFMVHQADPILWLLIYGLASCLPVAVWSWMVGRGSRQVRADVVVRRSIKHLGYRMIPGSVADVILLRLDRLLLPVFGSFAGLGIYVVASTFSELSTMFVRQYIDARTPLWKKRYDEGDLLLRSLLATVLMLSTVVSVLVAVISYFSIPVLFGSDYSLARPLVPVLACAAALYGTSRLGIAVAVVIGKPQWASIINGCGAAVGTASYMILIPTFGPLGAAIGSLLSYASCAIATAALCLRSSQPAVQPSDESLGES